MSFSHVHCFSISSCSCELVWSPKQAAEKGIILEEGKHNIISELAHNIQEQALLGLAAVDYDTETFQSTVLADLKPWDGSDWTEEQRTFFHAEIFRLRRDLPAVAKLMGLPVKVCHAYYLGRYKNSNEYRLLKTVGMEERETKEEEQDVCAVCGDGGNLIICDGCEVEYHLACLKPALATVPEGHWECDECVDRHFLKAREDLMRKSMLFEPHLEDQTDKTLSTVNRTGSPQKQFYRPAAPVLMAIQDMARAIGEVLSINPTNSSTS